MHVWAKTDNFHRNKDLHLTFQTNLEKKFRQKVFTWSPFLVFPRERKKPSKWFCRHDASRRHCRQMASRKKEKAAEAPTCFACICETLLSNMSSWWTMLELILMNNSSDQEKDFQPFTPHRTLTQCAATLYYLHTGLSCLLIGHRSVPKDLSHFSSVSWLFLAVEMEARVIYQRAAHTVHAWWPCGFRIVTRSSFFFWKRSSCRPHVKEHIMFWRNLSTQEL